MLVDLLKIILGGFFVALGYWMIGFMKKWPYFQATPVMFNVLMGLMFIFLGFQMGSDGTRHHGWFFILVSVAVNMGSVWLMFVIDDKLYAARHGKSS